MPTIQHKLTVVIPPSMLALLDLWWPKYFTTRSEAVRVAIARLMEARE